MRLLTTFLWCLGLVQGYYLPVQEIHLTTNNNDNVLWNIFNKYSYRRLLNDPYSSYSLHLKARKLKDVENRSFEEVNCDNLRSLGIYNAIAKDVTIIIKSNDTATSLKKHKSSTLMSKDLSCVVSMIHLEDGIQMRGVHLHPEKGQRSFEVITCPDNTTSNEMCLSLETDPVDDYECATIQLKDDNLRRKLDSSKQALPFKLEKWDDCYDGEENTHEIEIGIGVGSELVKRLGESTNVISFVEAIVSETNVVFLQQLNIKFLVKEIQIIEPSAAGSLEWDNPGCEVDIYDHLNRLISSDRTDLALWKILDDCHTTGPIGIAVINKLCGGATAAGLTYFSDTGGTWKIFAHEVGHIFGASHSFEEGAGSTGGLMDYGDGVYKNEVQFNSRYRRQEMCSFIRRNKDCPHIRVLTPEKIASFESCGNGQLDAGEECECPNGLRECDCCSDCSLKSSALCSPFTNECCKDDCTYQPTNRICSHSDGPGYCRNGYCASSECALIGLGDYCGVQNKHLPCRKTCFNTVTGFCSVPTNVFYYGRNLKYFRNGAFCQTPDINFGQCFDGICHQVNTMSFDTTYSPTSFPSTFGTSFPTIFPTKTAPTSFPTTFPTTFPTETEPTKFPTTLIPTPFPTSTSPTSFPTTFPTEFPTSVTPTRFPTTASPTSFPTSFPTKFPTTN